MGMGKHRSRYIDTCYMPVYSLFGRMSKGFPRAEADL
jgi:hypothetical protein